LFGFRKNGTSAVRRIDLPCTIDGGVTACRVDCRRSSCCCLRYHRPELRLELL